MLILHFVIFLLFFLGFVSIAQILFYFLCNIFIFAFFASFSRKSTRLFDVFSLYITLYFYAILTIK